MNQITVNALLETALPGDVITFHRGVGIRLGARISRLLAWPPWKGRWPAWRDLASHVGIVGSPDTLLESTTLNTELDVHTERLHRGVAEVELRARVLEAIGAGTRVYLRRLRAPLSASEVRGLRETWERTRDWKYVDFDLKGVWKLGNAELFDYGNARTWDWIQIGPGERLQVICSEYVAMLLEGAGRDVSKPPRQHSPTDWFLDYGELLFPPLEVIDH